MSMAAGSRMDKTVWPMSVQSFYSTQDLSLSLSVLTAIFQMNLV